jgi:hypothetical protein
MLLAALFLAPVVHAHQQKEALTKVLFNPRTGNIEVMHRFLLHDAEHALKTLRNSGANILGSETDRQFFAAYVNERFSIADQDGRSLPLKPVGHEIEGRFLWIYAETAMPGHVSSLTLRHDALRDIWPEQVNLVNVERNGVVKSIAFEGGSTELTVAID